MEGKFIGKDAGTRRKSDEGGKVVQGKVVNEGRVTSEKENLNKKEK